MGRLLGDKPSPGRLQRFCEWLNQQAAWENPPVPAPEEHEKEGAYLEAYKTRLTHWEHRWRYYFDWHLESFKLMGVFAQNATRAVFLLNGGALVALLGAAWKESGGKPLFLPADIIAAGKWFFVGLVLSVVISGASYLAQHEFTSHFNRRGAALQILGIFCFITSLVMFCVGSFCALDALRTH